MKKYEVYEHIKSQIVKKIADINNNLLVYVKTPLIYASLPRDKDHYIETGLIRINVDKHFQYDDIDYDMIHVEHITNRIVTQYLISVYQEGDEAEADNVLDCISIIMREWYEDRV